MDNDQRLQRQFEKAQRRADAIAAEIHESLRLEQIGLAPAQRAFRQKAFELGFPGAEFVMSVQLVHDNEAGIVPVLGVLASRIPEARNKKRRLHAAPCGFGLLLGRSGSRLGASSRRGAGGRRGASGGRGGSTFGRRGFGNRRGGGSRSGGSSSLLFFDHAGGRQNGADGEVTATDDRLHT